MAPMTRCMADDVNSPTEMMAAYYRRRAGAGLIVTEGTIISPSATGYNNVPGIFTQKQIDGWRLVTEAVHHDDGRIFLQIWHVGRVSHPSFLNGELPISASDTVMTGRIKRSEGLNYGPARAATIDEIHALVVCFANAAENAMKAGFDGVEIHGANGYLIDQFLHCHTNLRQDEYGVTPENMVKFPLDVVNACIQRIGAHKVGVRLSPGAYLNEIVGDKRDKLVFQTLFERLNKLSLAYVHTGNFSDKVLFPELDNKTMTAFIRANYQGTLIACGGYSFEEAQNHIKNHDFDLIAIGRPFIANPDLISKLKKDESIRAYDDSMLSTLY